MNIDRTCPACGGRGFSSRNLLPELITHTCKECGLLLGTIERTGPTVSEFALVDEAAYLNSVGEVRRRQAVEILALLGPYVAAGARLLDVGCSFGFFLLEARRAGYAIQGIEPDPQALEHARSSLGNDVVLPGFLSQDSAPIGPADVVCTLDVIEHIAPGEQEGFGQRVAETLAPGGVWVIKVPTTEGIYYKLSDLLIRIWPAIGTSFVRRLWQTRYEFPHLVYFDRRNLTMWLSRHGFEVIEHRYLVEVPTDTVVDRLTTDHDISRQVAYLLAPWLAGINLIERFRGLSDSLLVLARRGIHNT